MKERCRAILFTKGIHEERNAQRTEDRQSRQWDTNGRKRLRIERDMEVEGDTFVALVFAAAK